MDWFLYDRNLRHKILPLTAYPKIEDVMIVKIHRGDQFKL